METKDRGVISQMEMELNMVKKVTSMLQSIEYSSQKNIVRGVTRALCLSMAGRPPKCRF